MEEYEIIGTRILLKSCEIPLTISPRAVKRSFSISALLGLFQFPHTLCKVGITYLERILGLLVLCDLASQFRSSHLDCFFEGNDQRVDAIGNLLELARSPISF